MIIKPLRCLIRYSVNRTLMTLKTALTFDQSVLTRFAVFDCPEYPVSHTSSQQLTIFPQPSHVKPDSVPGTVCTEVRFIKCCFLLIEQFREAERMDIQGCYVPSNGVLDLTKMTSLQHLCLQNSQTVQHVKIAEENKVIYLNLGYCHGLLTQPSTPLATFVNLTETRIQHVNFRGYLQLVHATLRNMNFLKQIDLRDTPHLAYIRVNNPCKIIHDADMTVEINEHGDYVLSRSNGRRLSIYKDIGYKPVITLVSIDQGKEVLTL